MNSLDTSGNVPKPVHSKTGIDWQAIAVREYEELRTLLAKTPSSGNLKAAGQVLDAPDSEDRAREDRTPEAAGNRSIRLGVAFHEAMEQVDFLSADGMGELAQSVATRHRLDPASLRMLEGMMHVSLASDLLSRAREAARLKKRVFRELPFVRPLDSRTIEEGKIDLLFEEESGWVLVDYKTDWVAHREEGVEEFFCSKYTVQIREYVAALASLSIKVEAAYLLLARTGDAIRVI